MVRVGHFRGLVLVACASLAGAGCGSIYDDSGKPEPASPWPWVCPDGAPAPEAGCEQPLPPCSGPDGGEDPGADGC